MSGKQWRTHAAANEVVRPSVRPSLRRPCAREGRGGKDAASEGEGRKGKGGFAGVDSRVRNNERTKEQVYEAPTTITTVTATEWGGAVDGVASLRGRMLLDPCGRSAMPSTSCFLRRSQVIFCEGLCFICALNVHGRHPTRHLIKVASRLQLRTLN